MFIKMQGKLGQGDKEFQTEVIKSLLANDRTKLCVVVDEYATFAMQDDTAVPLDYPHKVVSLLEFANFKDILKDIERQIDNDGPINKFLEYVFSLEGLVAINTKELGKLKEVLIPQVEKYYFEFFKSDVKRTVHCVQIGQAI